MIRIKVQRSLYVTLSSQSIWWEWSEKVTVLARSLRKWSSLWSSCFSLRQQSVNNSSGGQTSSNCPVILRSAMRVLSQVNLLLANELTPLSSIYNTHPHAPSVQRPGDIEHLIKHTLSGSNVTILSRSLSIPPWPFPVFNFVGCQAWRCSRMGGIQRSHAGQEWEVVVVVGGFHWSHVKHWKLTWPYKRWERAGHSQSPIVQLEESRSFSCRAGISRHVMTSTHQMDV